MPDKQEAASFTSLSVAPLQKGTKLQPFAQFGNTLTSGHLLCVSGLPLKDSQPLQGRRGGRDENQGTFAGISLHSEMTSCRLQSES